MIDSGSTASPRLARLRRRLSWIPAKTATARTNSTQPSAGGSLPSALIALIFSSLTEMLVPPLMSSSTTPWKARKPASVTTKDGIPIFATSSPIRVPITAPVTSAATMDRYHGQLCSVSRTARTAAHTPLAYPADRSISPSSRTNTSPIAMAITAAPWASRLAKLTADRNAGRAIANPVHSTIRPSTAGSAPMSPPRIRAA